MPLLLLASIYFYASFIPAYLLILVAVIVVDYFAGMWIERSSGSKRKWCLLASIVANVGILGVFKYYNFFADNIRVLCAAGGLPPVALPVLEMALPIGLSFHTFQSMSYTIEVYRGAVPAERNFLMYALYVMFFPQLVAGPIERPQNMIHQFHEEKRFDEVRVVKGLQLMLWGFVKKIAIADRLSELVDSIYATPSEFSGWLLVFGTVCFAFQIYCDFSGYTDIAIGAAQVLGFRMMENFRRPYFARNLHEFWRRWHISLSTWFRDYVYFPLGGNRVGMWLNIRNLFVVFMLSGLWHGANWTFVMWGALHGTAFAFLVLLKRFSKGWELPAPLALLSTFAFVCITWVYFRADNVGIANTIVAKMFTAHSVLAADRAWVADHSNAIFWALAVIVGLVLVEWLQDWFSLRQFSHKFPRPVRWAAYYAAACAILLVGIFDSRPFIYFQF